jgi:formate/nitrite transporter FocA (FNT family)
MENQVFRANSRSFMSKIFCSVMIAMAIVCFASCDSKHPSKLVGKWKEKSTL